MVITGEFMGNADRGGGTLTSAGERDIYLAKFSPGGWPLWSRRFGGMYSDGGSRVAVTAGDDIVIIGFLRSSLVDFGGGPLTKVAFRDRFVAKFSAAGIYRWVGRHGCTSNWDMRGLSVDTLGQPVVTGWFGGTVNFGGAPLTAPAATTAFSRSLPPEVCHPAAARPRAPRGRRRRSARWSWPT